MKVKLTKEWKRHGKSYDAKWNRTLLMCSCGCHRGQDSWRGQATMGIFHRGGPDRETVAAAQRDAERFAVEILLDIRDGTEVLLARRMTPRNWKQDGYVFNATWKDINLSCLNASPSPGWIGRVSMKRWAIAAGRLGSFRRSFAAAKKDAEMLAEELLLDIRDGAKALMTEYGMNDGGTL